MIKATRFFVLYAACVFGITFVMVSVAMPQGMSQDEIKSLAVSYVQSHEPALKATSNDRETYTILRNLCPAALRAGDAEKAKSLAKMLLEIAPRFESQPGFGPGMKGSATHIANIILGLIALDEGKTAQAKEHLRAAGSIKVGDPTLRSFGPDMLLAKRLIEKGERSTAAEYLDLCVLFWTSARTRVGVWKNAVNDGGMPDFGANLGYITETWHFAK